jgi:hypothetical protein
MVGNVRTSIRDIAANACQDIAALTARLLKMVAPAIHVKTKPRVRVWEKISYAHVQTDTLENDVRSISTIAQRFLVEMAQNVSMALVVIHVNAQGILAVKIAILVGTLFSEVQRVCAYMQLSVE